MNDEDRRNKIAKAHGKEADVDDLLKLLEALLADTAGGRVTLQALNMIRAEQIAIRKDLKECREIALSAEDAIIDSGHFRVGGE